MRKNQGSRFWMGKDQRGNTANTWVCYAVGNKQGQVSKSECVCVCALLNPISCCIYT